MKELKLLLFDLDDTLLHMDDYWGKSMYEAFASFPLTQDIGMERLFPVFMKYDEALHEQWMDGTINGKEFRLLRFVHTLGEFGLSVGAEEADAFEQWFRTVRAAYIPHDPHLVERLQRWSREWSLAILTNGTFRDQHDKLYRMGLGSLFTENNVFTSEEVGLAKPAREAYLHAASSMECEPEQVLFVGDSWQNDVVGPIAAGMRAIWMNRSGKETPQGEVLPEAIIRGLDELESYIKERWR